MSDKKTDIWERTFDFAVSIVKLCYYLEREKSASKVLTNQLIKAGTSIGANLEEGQAGQSTADFISKNSISLKEARETNYWLRLILATTNFDEKIKSRIGELSIESQELAKIIATVIISAKKAK